MTHDLITCACCLLLQDRPNESLNRAFLIRLLGECNEMEKISSGLHRTSHEVHISPFIKQLQLLFPTLSISLVLYRPVRSAEDKRITISKC